MIVTVRLPAILVGRLEKLVARVRAEIPYVRITRADVIRQALEIGLRELERRGRKR